jgi:hypothetical protein
LSDGQKTKICNALLPRLMARKGPFGFGVFNRSTCIDSDILRAEDSESWIVTIDKPSPNGAVRMSLNSLGKSTKEGILRFGLRLSAEDWADSLSSEQVSWLVAFGLLDQLPVLGLMDGRNTVSGKPLKALPDPLAEILQSEPDLNLLAVHVSFDRQRRIWSVNEAPQKGRVLPEKDIHIANLDGRGANRQIIEQALDRYLQDWSVKRAADKEAALMAARLKAEELAAEASRIPRIPEPVSALWLTLQYHRDGAQLGGDMGHDVEARGGWSGPLFRWAHFRLGLERSFYKASYRSALDESSKTAALVLDESVYGIGIKYRNDLSYRLWLMAYLDFVLRSQTVNLSERRQADFEFVRLSESNLMGIGSGANMNLIMENWFFSIGAGVETLVPHADQYWQLKADTSIQYVFAGRNANTQNSAASQDTKQRGISSSVNPSRLYFRSGPSLRVSAKDLKRTFPARDAGNLDAASTHVSLLTMTIGVTAYVAF